MVAKEKHYEKIYRKFGSAISEKYDCGRICAPLNGGQPVCCTVDNAVPVVTNHEWRVLKKRTDLWFKFEPQDAVARQIVDDLPKSCKAIECKGAAFCERENRTLACRAFPFFPYFNREKELIGLSYYWTFEDRCWVMSNLQIVEQAFIDEFIDTYEFLFKKDDDELEAFLEQSSNMRRVYSRWNREIPIIARDGSYLKVLPKSGGKIVPAELSDFAKHGPFVSDKAYKKAIKEEGGKAKGKTLTPDWSVRDWWNHD